MLATGLFQTRWPSLSPCPYFCVVSLITVCQPLLTPGDGHLITPRQLAATAFSPGPALEVGLVQEPGER